MPAPIAPWMLASEALTIWMFEHRHEGAERGADHGDPGLQRRRRRLALLDVRAGGLGQRGHDTCSFLFWRVQLAACTRVRECGEIRKDYPGWLEDAVACRRCGAGVQRLGINRRFDRHAGAQRACEPASSSTIFTGMRCTILVKLPVALSGGSSANSSPLAGETLSTWPCSRHPGKPSTLDPRPAGRARTCAKLRFLEVGDDIDGVQRHHRHQLGARRHIVRRPAAYGRRPCRRPAR